MFKSILNEFGGNLDTIICGGAYLDKFYIKWFRSIGINILNGYGITECGPVVSVNQVENYKDGSVGIPCKGVEVKVIDGELCVKGDNVMKGYYKDPKSNAAVFLNFIMKPSFFYIFFTHTCGSAASDPYDFKFPFFCIIIPHLFLNYNKIAHNHFKMQRQLLEIIINEN